MADAFIGEIRLFGISYPPRGWIDCNGQILPISENTALFSVMQTIYGGDGRTTLGIPNFNGRGPRGVGLGPGTPHIEDGQIAGYARLALDVSEMPKHRHDLFGDDRIPEDGTPDGQSMFGKFTHGGAGDAYLTSSLDVYMHPDMLEKTGQGLSHENRQPYLTLRFCMCLDGYYPHRN